MVSTLCKQLCLRTLSVVLFLYILPSMVGNQLAPQSVELDKSSMLRRQGIVPPTVRTLGSNADSTTPTLAPTAQPTYFIFSVPTLAPTVVLTPSPTTVQPSHQPTAVGRTPAPSGDVEYSRVIIDLSVNFDVAVIPSPRARANFSACVTQELESAMGIPSANLTLLSMSVTSSLSAASVLRFVLRSTTSELLTAVASHPAEVLGTGDLLSQLENVIANSSAQIVSGLQASVDSAYNASDAQVMEALLEHAAVPEVFVAATSVHTPSPTRAPTSRSSVTATSSMIVVIVVVVVVIVVALMGALFCLMTSQHGDSPSKSRKMRTVKRVSCSSSHV